MFDLNKPLSAQGDVLLQASLYSGLKVRILAPVIVTMILVFAFSLFGMYWLQRTQHDEEMAVRATGALKAFSDQLDNDAELLSGLLRVICVDEDLQKAWLSKDREGLLFQASSIYEQIHTSNRVTHFYFIDLEKTCFLRVHNPTQFGDTIKRYTLDDAVQNGKTAHGIELGKYGNFTQRVVQPWLIDGELVGYIELGEELEHVTEKLSETLGVDLVFAIEKRFLDQTQWEKGMVMLGRSPNWNQLSKFIVADKTIDKIPSELEAQLDSRNSLDTFVDFTDASNQRTYHSEIVPLIDAGEREVGSLVVMNNVTQQITELRTLITVLSIVVVIIGGVLLVVYYSHVNRIQKTLRDMSGQLVRTAHEAGMAEVATSVLHNVGNVLNSVNVSAGLIQDKVSHSGVSSLTRAVDIMQQHIDDLGDYVTQDERGKHLPRFLSDLSQQMASDEELILEEVQSLTSNIDHIKAIVATQQSYATGISAVVEEVQLADLLEDAIHINTASIERHSVEIIRQFNEMGSVAIDKQKLLQIMVNLISNAKYACVESDNEDHQITVSLRCTDEDRVLIEVEDNGKGIAAENLTRIFAHGFTTRKEGHGFGLHSAVLAAKELGGSLAAHSEGPGMGATFTIDLPCKEAGVAPCLT